VELLGGLADGEPAANFQYRYSAGFADINFHGHSVSHSALSIGSLRQKSFPTTRRPSRITMQGRPQALYDAGRAGQGNAHGS
jgi:hypothetical protein